MIGRSKTLLGITLGVENNLNFENYKYSEYDDGIFFNNGEDEIADFDESIYCIYYATHAMGMKEFRDILYFKCSIVYKFYKLLVNKDKKWFNFPIYRKINTINFKNYAYIEKIDSKKITTNNFIKDTFWDMEVFEILHLIITCESSGMYDLRDIYIDKFLLKPSIDWKKIIGNGICPYCHKKLNSAFKINQLSDIEISQRNNEYYLNANLTCNKCRIFDNPDNKTFLYTLDDQTNQLINYLYKQLNNTNIPKFYWYIINTQNQKNKEILNLIIVFKQIRKKFHNTLNILFEIVMKFLTS